MSDTYSVIYSPEARNDIKVMEGTAQSYLDGVSIRF